MNANGSALNPPTINRHLTKSRLFQSLELIRTYVAPCTSVLKLEFFGKNNTKTEQNNAKN